MTWSFPLVGMSSYGPPQLLANRLCRVSVDVVALILHVRLTFTRTYIHENLRIPASVSVKAKLLCFSRALSTGSVSKCNRSYRRYHSCPRPFRDFIHIY